MCNKAQRVLTALAIQVAGPFGSISAILSQLPDGLDSGLDVSISADREPLTSDVVLKDRQQLFICRDKKLVSHQSRQESSFDQQSGACYIGLQMQHDLFKWQSNVPSLKVSMCVTPRTMFLLHCIEAQRNT